MKINRLISAYNNESRQGWSVNYIVIHYVGAVSTAHDNARYFAGGDRQASAHYFVDEESIWQSVEESRAAWHCGGPLQGTGGHSFFGYCTNLNSIGIEMCVVKEKGKYIVKEKTVDNTGELVRDLMKRYGVSKEHVIRHYDVTGKSCPAAYPEYAPDDYLLSSAAWDRFRNRLVGDEIKSKITLTSENYPTVLEKGDRFRIKGKIRSAVKLKSVTVVVEKKNGVDLAYATKKRYTSLRTFDLAKIDPYIAFRKLPVGEYRYKIKAEDVNGTKKTLMARPFKVVKTIKKGQTK